MLARLLDVFAVIAVTVDVTGLMRELNALDVVGAAELVVEDAMLLVFASKLVLTAARLLAACVVSLVKLDAVDDTTGVSALNPEMEKLPPFKLDSVLESDEDSTLVVDETWLSIELSVAIAPETTFERRSVEVDGMTDDPRASAAADVTLDTIVEGIEATEVTACAAVLTTPVAAEARLLPRSVRLATGVPVVAVMVSTAEVKGAVIDEDAIEATDDVIVPSAS